MKTNPALVSRVPAAPAYAFGFSARKRRLLRGFFDEQAVQAVQRLCEVPDGADLLVWGRTPVPEHARLRRVLRVEDGFVRSVGLGAAFARPLSWVFDHQGMHYDATRPSALEQLLQNTAFDEPLLARAAALRLRLVAQGLTKYNLPGTAWQRPEGAGRVCLVVGQVESDAALALGSPRWRSNLALLRHLREQHPHAFLLYKPHPDVCAGVRAAGDAEHQARRWCDEVIEQADMAQLLGAVDECHVMTSLAGFEALLRGVPVVTHGQPFYAGWGLTQDQLPLPRRTRQLSIDQLVAGALLLYPRYVSARTGRRCDAETALDELAAARSRAGATRSVRDTLGTWAGRITHALRRSPWVPGSSAGR